MPASDVDSRQLNKARRNAEIMASSGNEWADAFAEFVPELSQVGRMIFRYDQIANSKTLGGWTSQYAHRLGLLINESEIRF